MRAGLVGTAAAVIAALLLAGCAHRPPAPETYPFELTLDRLEGGRVYLPAYRGRVVVVTFFATWCMPCLVEIPLFNRLQARYGAEGLAVFGVSVDEGGRDVLELFRRRFDVRYPILLAGPDVLSGKTAFGPIPGIPATFLLDREGRPVAAFMGAAEPERFEALVQDVLAGRTHGQPLAPPAPPG